MIWIFIIYISIPLILFSYFAYIDVKDGNTDMFEAPL